jgi:hypothetical protein
LAQSKVLIQSVLGLPELDLQHALEVVIYHQHVTLRHTALIAKALSEWLTGEAKSQSE